MKQDEWCDHPRCQRLEELSERLAAYVKQRMIEINASGKGWLAWPTVAELARRYRVRQSLIIDLVESHENLELIVAMQAGSGYAEFNRPGEYRVEYYV